MSNEKKLAEAWKKFHEEHPDEVLPTDDTGAVHYNPQTEKAARIVYYDNLDKVARYMREVDSVWDKRSWDEQRRDFKRRFRPHLAPMEYEIIASKFIENKTFEEISLDHAIVGGASVAHRLYKRALKKLEKVLRTDDSK